MGGVGDSLFGKPRSAVEAALHEREPVACPLCRLPPRPFAVDFQGFRLARCAGCGLEFQSPRPVFDHLATAVYGASYHPAAHGAVDPVRRRHYLRQLAGLRRHLPAGRRTLLDVGCGAGAFLRLAGRCGWRVDGTDIRLTDAARRTGVRLWEGQLPHIRFDGARFDGVRFNHVLEHTQDPLAELRRARGLVSAGGALLVGVPNLAGLSLRLKSWQSRCRLKRRRWKHYGALHHLWFFTPATLARLVAEAGFEVLRYETPVIERPGRPGWLSALVRPPLEAVRAGGIVDLYACAR